ncbi:putative major facilitator superfamily-containing protein 5 [Coleophoma cylindrospora]|uniref:Molybdate-anion transporter n=1 Tax=Coleophoma cylindrospora TaxID=1849047 RepID=A0A3D8RMK3_9HELO|nr:putative major facilitator superfamily-containing protein 5 [Coleophoma cylindrospora]
MDFYASAFVLLISACGLLTWRQYRTSEETTEQKSLTQQDAYSPSQKAEAQRFSKLFLTVYCLVMASDWLQGPYVYSLYKDQFELQETVVAALFTTGFVSAGISGYYAGHFADKFGRKTACLLFCVTYATSCFSTLIPSLPVLFIGRVFGGVSTSLMYSAVESWMVTEYHKRQLEKSGTSLSSMFGIMTTLNSVMAILSGIFSEWLVRITSTRRSPFMASAALLIISFMIISRTWTENYGDSGNVSETSNSTVPAKNVIKMVFTDQRILTLGLASCFFEGSMYLFVFFWTPALKAARSQASTNGDHHAAGLPLGMIFACFMASVMLGSLLFNLLVSKYRIISHSRLLTIIFATASSSLLVTVVVKDETLTFWSFCIFEACVGMYWPSVGYLKGRVIDDSVRARVYGLMRIPLNVFVVVALSLIQEGEAYRNQVFMTCSGLLVVVSGIFHYAVTESVS